jgi:hypothetical protein
MVDLKKLERDAFRRFYEDGLMDIYFGAMLIVFAASSMLWERIESEAALYLGMITLALIVTVPLLLLRRRLLRERLGTFRPGPQRKLRISRTRWVLLGSVVLGVALLLAGLLVGGGVGSAEAYGVAVSVIWFINCVVVFGAGAYLLEVPRFYVYGFVGGLLMPAMILPDVLWGIKIEIWLLFGLAGLAAIAVGLFKLRRFLHQYPAPRQG